MLRTVKERVRHTLYSLGLKRRPAYLKGDSVKDRFAAIYDDGVWTHDSDAPLSGTGSTMEATAALRARLPAFLDEVGATTLLDVGCGDFFWMQATPLNQRYIGIDVVPSVIETNQARFAADGRTFALGNAIEDELPDAEVVMCREVLFHLSFEHGLQVLRNMLSKPRTHFILTSDRDTRFNSNIETGAFRLLNLEVKPYLLPPPIETISDGAIAPNRFMGIWTAAQLAHLR